MEETRRQGYAVSLAEVTAGACGISAPVLGPSGWAVASIGVSGPLERLTDRRRAEVAEVVRDAAQRLSLLVKQHLASHPPSPTTGSD